MVTQFFATGDTSSSDALLERLRETTKGLYDVAGEIGRGGMAVVYIATDMRLGRKVAIKVMEPRLSFTPGMAERFLLEARIAAQLQHHNIIVVHEVQQDAELIFFVMRLVEGGSLDEVCRRLTKHNRTLPLDQAQWILWQSARALSYAHAEGIVHRDVKPANILVTTKGEVVVTDFGIAKAADGEGLTKSGMAIGTPVYMSPEQFTGTEPVSGAADQYALGIAAYELLAGAPPFSGDLYRLIAAHGNTVPQHLRELRPDCPAPLADAIMRMLEKKPADRWPSLDAVLPVLGAGLSIDGSDTRSGLAAIASELQAARESAVAAWAAMAPSTPPWSSGSRRRTGPVASAVSVSPPGGEVLVGATLDLRAVVTAESGTTIGDATVTWTSSDPNVVTVTPGGTVTGVAVGSASVRAQVSTGSGGSTGVVQTVVSVTVAARAAARVRITQGELSLECGEAMQLTPEAFDVLGAPADASGVTWSSSAPEVLHVDSRGTIMALTGGVATVTARLDGVIGTTRVEVREAPVGSVTLVASDNAVSIGAEVSLELAVLDVSGIRRSDAGLVVVSDRPEVVEVRADPLTAIARSAGRATLRVVHAESGRSSVAAPWATCLLEVRAPVVERPPLPSVETRGASDAASSSVPLSATVVMSQSPTPAASSPAAASVAATAAASAAPKSSAVRPPVASTAPGASTASTASGASTASTAATADALPSSVPSPVAAAGPGRLIALGVGGVAVAAALWFMLGRSSGDADANVAQTSADSVANIVAAGGEASAVGAGVAQADPSSTAIPPNSATDAPASSADFSTPNALSERESPATLREPVRPQPTPTNPASSSAVRPSAGNASAAIAPTGRTGAGAIGSTAGAASGTPATRTPPTSTPATSTPPVVEARPDEPEVAPPPVVVAGPSDDDARALAGRYAARLVQGEFRDGEMGSFFSRTTSAHNASVAGAPRVVSREGSTMTVDVDVQLERTLGSGAVNRRASTVRLVLRGAPGQATIQSATAGPLRNPR